MNDPSLVRIQWTQLLILAGLLDLLGKEYRHLPQLDILPFAVRESVNENPAAVVEVAAVRHVDDVLKRFQRLSAVTDQNFRLLSRQIDARAIRGFLNVDRGFDAHGCGEPFQELDNGCG
jgi:hypothetical protein